MQSGAQMLPLHLLDAYQHLQCLVRLVACTGLDLFVRLHGVVIVVALTLVQPMLELFHFKLDVTLFVSCMDVLHVLAAIMSKLLLYNREGEVMGLRMYQLAQLRSLACLDLWRARHVGGLISPDKA